jgi:hypothetical protein
VTNRQQQNTEYMGVPHAEVCLWPQRPLNR